jgi:hypothetical protein
MGFAGPHRKLKMDLNTKAKLLRPQVLPSLPIRRILRTVKGGGDCQGLNTMNGED